MKLNEIITGLCSGKLDLKEYADSLFQKIESRESEIKAIIPDTCEKQRVYEEISTLLESYPDPSKRPPLFGLPVGFKDIIRIDGFPTRCGSSLPSDLFEGPQAECVSRLKKAGAFMMAKTVTTEFAFNEPGPTRNPYNPKHTPGGSSSGSAAGVACGFFPLALGSQTVGSVIRPAAFCGVVGFKPSYERIPITGVIPYSISADHVGTFTKDVSGIDLVMSVLTDNWQKFKDDRLPESIALGVPEGPYLNRATKNGRAFFEKQAARIQQAGFHVKRVHTFEDFERVERNHRRLIAGEMARYHAPWFEAQKDLYRPRTVEQIEKGFHVSDEEIESLQIEQHRLRDTIEAKMTSEAIDFWICPPATDHAPRGLKSTGDAVMNLPWTSAGLPVVTVPAGKDALGLPHGVQIVGRFMEDEKLVPIAERLFEILEGSGSFSDVNH